MGFKMELLKCVPDITMVNSYFDYVKVKHWKFNSPKHWMKGTSGWPILWQNYNMDYIFISFEKGKT